MKTLGLPSLTLEGGEVREERSALVYAWIREGATLYVGKGAGMVRPLARDHHAIRHMRDSDQLLIWFFDSDRAASRAETAAIRAAKPRFNRAMIVLHEENLRSALLERREIVQRLATLDRIIQNSRISLAEEAAVANDATSLTQGDPVLDPDTTHMSDGASFNQLVDERPRASQDL